MKKIYFTLAFLATLVSCTNDELVDMTPKQAITFGNAFVENNTRAAIDPSYNNTTNLLTSFKVYGTVSGNVDGKVNTANIYKGDEVKTPEGWESNKDGLAWDCTNIQYWVPNCFYNFIAIVDATDVSTTGNGLPKSIKYNAADQKDLLLATANHETDKNGIPNTSDDKSATAIAPVKFTFNHLLSKVKFTVKNTMSNNTSIYSYQVRNVRIINAVMEGKVTIKEPTWTSSSKTYTEDEPLSFGNISQFSTNSNEDVAVSIGEAQQAESHYERLLIPYDYSKEGLKVKFTVDILVNETVVNRKNYEADVKMNLAVGNSYNFIIELALDKEIKFSVSKINDWSKDDNGDEEGDNNETLTLVDVTETQA